MLTSAESIVHYDASSGIAQPDRLTRKTHGHYLGYAARMLQVYRRGIGSARRDLHRQVEGIMAALDDCPQRRVAAFCKLLDDASTYQVDRRGAAAALRKRVCTLAGPMHPLVSSVEGVFGTEQNEAKQRIAAELGMSWQQIDERLFADVIEFQKLREFTGYASGEALLARYNVAQLQAALYRAERLSIWSRTDHKTILRYAKLARLMHTISRNGDGSYHFRFDGPASILRRSTRYGVAFARLVPGLLSCRQWHATARLRGPRGRGYALRLSSDDGLSSPVAAAEPFDSQVEADFARRWGDQKRAGWTLHRETDLLVQGQRVFTPDFVLSHDDGRRVLLEIIGYWTPEYLIAKAETVRMFADQPLLLAVADQASFDIPTACGLPIRYKKQLKPQDVLQRLSPDPTAGAASVATSAAPPLTAGPRTGESG